MIDGKKLAKDEAFMRTMAEKHSGGTECFLKEAEIIRHARRYLVLRKHGVLIGIPHNLKLVSDGDLDAAADRLLEGGE